MADLSITFTADFSPFIKGVINAQRAIELFGNAVIASYARTFEEATGRRAPGSIKTRRLRKKRARRLNAWFEGFVNG